jgi:hypothetical protein
MGRSELAALAKVIEEQLKEGTNSALMGTWTIRFDKVHSRFYFEKCEFGEYCEERPVVVSTAGDVIDRGGPLYNDET